MPILYLGEWPGEELKRFRPSVRLDGCMLQPIDKAKWDYAKAAHLLNRAGFGGTPAEIGWLAALSPEEAVLSLVNYENTPIRRPARIGRNPTPAARNACWPCAGRTRGAPDDAAGGAAHRARAFD